MLGESFMVGAVVVLLVVNVAAVVFGIVGLPVVITLIFDSERKKNVPRLPHSVLEPD